MKPIFVLFGEKIHDMVEYKAIFGLGIPPKIGWGGAGGGQKEPNKVTGCQTIACVIELSVCIAPGAVARSEACPLGMQAALSLIPMSSTFFRADLVMKHFYGHSPSADSRRAVVSHWRKNVHEVLVNYLGGLPRNSMVRVTDPARCDLKCVEGP